MLVGLHGKKRAGKDTVFARLRHLYGGYMPVERVSFADLLYQSAAASLGVKVRDLQNWKSDSRVEIQVIERASQGYQGIRPDRIVTNLNVREYLQAYGTEAHRDVFGPNFWVEQVDLSHEGKVVVVTDVRFDNEAQAVKAAGGKVVHVIGSDDVEGADDAHASEAGLGPDLIDRVLPNIARYDDFRLLDAEVDSLMDWMVTGVTA